MISPETGDFTLNRIKHPGNLLHDEFLMELVRLAPEMVYPHDQLERFRLEYARKGMDHHQSELKIFRQCCNFFLSKKPPHALFSELVLKALMKGYFNGKPFLYKNPVQQGTYLNKEQIQGIQIAEDHAQNLYQIYISESHASEQILPDAIQMALDSNIRLLYHVLEERRALLTHESYLLDYHNFLFDAWARNPNEGFALNLVNVISYKDAGCDCDIHKAIQSSTIANQNRLNSVLGPSSISLNQHFILFPMEDLDWIIHDLCNRLLI
ncbi:hypothetical protein [Sediminicola luteus]|nr:hypothetical protein [Sediminicola luteus]